MSLDRTEKVFSTVASGVTIVGAFAALTLWLVGAGTEAVQPAGPVEAREPVGAEVPPSISSPAWKVVQVVLIAISVAWVALGWSYANSETTAKMIAKHLSVGLPFYLCWFCAVLVVPAYLLFHLGVAAYFDGRVWSVGFHVKALVLLALFGLSLRTFHRAYQIERQASWGRPKGFFDNEW